MKNIKYKVLPIFLSLCAALSLVFTSVSAAYAVSPNGSLDPLPNTISIQDVNPSGNGIRVKYSIGGAVFDSKVKLYNVNPSDPSYNHLLTESNFSINSSGNYYVYATDFLDFETKYIQVVIGSTHSDTYTLTSSDLSLTAPSFERQNDQLRTTSTIPNGAYVEWTRNGVQVQNDLRHYITLSSDGTYRCRYSFTPSSLGFKIYSDWSVNYVYESRPSTILTPTLTYNSTTGLLSWNSVNWATGYTLYYVGFTDNDDEEFAFDNHTYSTEPLAGIGDYYIVAYYLDGDYFIESNPSPYVTVFSIPSTSLQTPVITYNSSTKRISWNTISGATSYSIYTSTYEDGPFLYAVSTSGTSFTPIEGHYYKIMASTTDSSIYPSDFSNVVYCPYDDDDNPTLPPDDGDEPVPPVPPTDDDGILDWLKYIWNSIAYIFDSIGYYVHSLSSRIVGAAETFTDLFSWIPAPIMEIIRGTLIVIFLILAIKAIRAIL